MKSELYGFKMTSEELWEEIRRNFSSRRNNKMAGIY